MLTLLVGLAFAALVALEWWRGWHTVRVGTVLLALVVLFIAQRSPYRALRRTLSLPPAERVITVGGGTNGHRPSDFESGARTMYEQVVADAAIGAAARDLALAAVVWLALSPVLRSVWPRRPTLVRRGDGATRPAIADSDPALPAA